MDSWFFLVIVSSILMGLATLVEKTSLKIEHATQFSAALTPLVTLLSLVFIPWANFQLTAQQWIIMILLNVFNAYTFLLSMRIFKHGELSIASPLFSSLPTLLTVLFAFFFLGEVLSIWQYAIIVGMIITTYFLLFAKGRHAGVIGFDGKKYLYMMPCSIL